MPFDVFHESLEARRELHLRLRSWLTDLYRILATTPPDVWGFRLYLAMVRLRNEVDELSQTKEMEGAISYIQEYAKMFREEMRFVAHSSPHGSTERVLEAADAIVHRFAERVALSDGDVPRDDEYPEIVSIEELCRIPGITRAYDHGRKRECLRVCYDSKETLLPIPSGSGILHKGGTPRILLKMLVGAPSEQISAEIPLNDIDVLVTGPRETWQDEALRMGADLEGIEQIKEGFSSLERLFIARDVDLNQCFFGASGLVFSERAATAAQTGTIAVSGRNRILYGSETMVVEGKRLLKGRGLMRVLKFVAEGKAARFEISALNTRIDLGIYWLLLAKKFMKKTNGPELLTRLRTLVSRMQPERASLSTIEILDSLHGRYPFLEFSERPLSSTDVARWLAKKAMKEVDRHFRVAARVPRSPLFSEEELALTGTVTVSLDEYVRDEKEVEEIRSEWPAFLARCAERTALDAARREGVPPSVFLEDEEEK